MYVTNRRRWDCPPPTNSRNKTCYKSKTKGLVTYYGEGGGGYKWQGGAREVLPLRKWGAEKVLAMVKGGHKKFWGSFYTVA